MIALLAAVTCTFGNLAAYGQDNMKRLLAYSTIAHAGYMMLPQGVTDVGELSRRSVFEEVDPLFWTEPLEL